MVLLEAIGDQVADRADLEPVQLGEGDEVVQPRHGAVLAHDLADHSGRIETGEPGDIDSGLGMTGTHQHPALPRHQRKHMARRDNMVRALGRVDRDGDGAGAIGRGNAGGHALLGFDRNGEGSLVAGAILARHQWQAELVDARLAERQANQTAAVLGHEVDRVRRRHLRRNDEIPLIFPVFVVDEDEHAAVSRFVDQLLGGRQKPALHQRRSSSSRPM
jgi:hypothetical protein